MHRPVPPTCAPGKVVPAFLMLMLSRSSLTPQFRVACTQVAVKVVDVRTLTSVGALEQLQEEISALSTLRHKHIIRLRTVQLLSHSICFVTEHVDGGTLKQLQDKQV